MIDQSLFFKEFLPKRSAHDNKADRVWIHSDGNTVVLLDGVTGCSDPVAAVERCIDFLEDQSIEVEPGSSSNILRSLHTLLIDTDGEMAVGACVQNTGSTVEFAYVGNPRLIQFASGEPESLIGDPLNQPLQVLGMQGKVDPVSTRFEIPKDGICVLSSDGLCHEKLSALKDKVRSAHSNTEWMEIGEAAANDDDWSFVVFPVEQSYSYENANWPYNPFVGPQEDYEHEKRGLAELADSLFLHPDFNGFRIVGGGRFVRQGGQSCRLGDGLLISPWGVVLIELKDDDGTISLPFGGRQKPMVIFDGEGKVERRNPVSQISDQLRAFSTYDLGATVPTQLRNIGTVVFTHAQADVTCITQENELLKLPTTNGEVIVATPSSLPSELRKFVKRIVGKKAKPPLTQEMIEQICGALTGTNEDQSLGDHKPQRKIGRYAVDLTPIPEESTSYYDVFNGTSKRGEPVWVKKFKPVNLGRGKKDQVDESRLREVEALEAFMGNKCIQFCRDWVAEEDGLYVFLNRVDGPSLDKWLETEPSREDRVATLREIAYALSLLENEEIVHRGLTPHAIRIDSNTGKPVLINFELCQMDVFATLPMVGRRLIDVKYAAKEVCSTGKVVSNAADIYSFGKIICLCLSGELPFETFEHHKQFSRTPQAWENLFKTCGLDDGQGEVLQRCLSNNSQKRPTAQEMIHELEGWQ